MIKIYKYSCLFLLLTCSGSFIRAQKLELFVKPSQSEPYSISYRKPFQDSARIFSELQSVLQADIENGYALAGYDSIIYDSVFVRAYYYKGEQYKWGQIKINSPDISKKLTGSLPDSLDRFDFISFFDATSRLLKEYADNGYPFAGMKLDSVKITGNFVNAVVNIDTGDKYVFDSIIVKGESKIKTYYIRKIIEIEKDGMFSMSKINKLERQLKSISFIEQSRPYQLAFADGKTDIILYLRNKNASRFSGLIGILPNNKTTGKLLVTGDINLYLLNSAGFGELFMFKWQKFESQSQNLKTEISVPYLFKSDFGAGVKFDIEKKDSSYLNTDFTGQILYGNNTGNGFNLFFRRKSSYLLADTDLSSSEGFSDYSTNLYGLNYRFSNTDNMFNPVKGWVLLLSSGLGTKITQTEETDTPESVFQTRNSIDVSRFLPIGKYITIKLRNFTSSIYSVSVSDNELDLIGGLNTVRGFDELSLPASSFSVGNIELRYLFEEESALFAFFDAAYFEKRNTINDYHNFVMGTGIGLDLNTGAGTFSMVFAVGKQNENPFDFTSTKIHFGYRNSF